MPLKDRFRTGWLTVGTAVGAGMLYVGENYKEFTTNAPYPLDIEQHGRHVGPSFLGAAFVTSLIHERLRSMGVSDERAIKVARVVGAGSLVVINLALETPQVRSVFPNTPDILGDTLLYATPSAVAGSLMVRSYAEEVSTASEAVLEHTTVSEVDFSQARSVAQLEM